MSKQTDSKLEDSKRISTISGASIARTKKRVDEIEKKILEIHNKISLLL